MSRRRLRALLIALLVGAGLAATWLFQERSRAHERQLGAAMFSGQQALTARVLGHDMDLPSQASRCVNCHGDNAKNANGLNAAPALNRDSLLSDVARRGGPPSRYDSAALCTLLRSGVDPAHVMIPRTMPRYSVTEADCSALWAFLSTR